MKFVRFVIAAGLSVPFNLGSRVIFSYFVSFEIAVVLSQFVGMIVAFLLTRAFVFDSSPDDKIGEFSRFAIVNAVSLAQTWIVGVSVLRIVLPYFSFTYHPELVAHFVGLASSSVTAFIGHRYFSFREPMPPPLHEIAPSSKPLS
jgi:putative flippase GtrA